VQLAQLLRRTSEIVCGLRCAGVDIGLVEADSDWRLVQDGVWCLCGWRTAVISTTTTSQYGA
jgi:hypothetical protein